MKTIQMLEDEDIITKGDWCRPLYIMSMSGGMSDDYSFESFGEPKNNAKWCRVERSMPFWIGGSVGKYNTAMVEFNEYEFVRGDIPAHHVHPKAERPEYDQHLADGVYDHTYEAEDDDGIPF